LEVIDKKNNEGITAPTRNWRFSASYDSFVVNQTFVLRMNICGKNRQLLVAAKRYRQAFTNIAFKNQNEKKNYYIISNCLKCLQL
jgi:hypothetical protein